MTRKEAPRRQAQRSARADRARAAQQVRFRASLLDQVGAAVIACNAEGIVSYWNAYAAQLYGWSATETLGHPLRLFIVPTSADAAEQAQQIVQEALALGVWQGEYEAQHRDGHRFPAQVTLVALRNAQGQPAGIAGVSTDLSARVRLENALDARLRHQGYLAELGQLALQGTAIDILITSAFATIRRIFQADVCSLFALEEGGATLRLRAGFGWPQRQIGRKTVPVGHASLAGHTLAIGLPVIAPDLSAERRFHPWNVRGERAASALSVIVHGISSPYGVLAIRSREPRTFTQDDVHVLQAIANTLGAAFERAQSEAALRASEQHFRGVFENAAIGLFRLAPSGEVLLANPALAQILGCAAATDLIGRPLAAAIASVDATHITAARSAGAHETTWLRRDGAHLAVRLRVWPIVDASGALLYTEGSVEDVTEARGLAARLAQAERLSALGELAAGTAHEINNPLAVVVGHAELLLHGALTAQQRADVATIAQEATRAGEIVRMMLRFARQRDPSFLPVRLETVVQEALALRQHRLAQYHIAVTTDLQPLGEVRADRDQVLQVLVNLLNNAIDAMAEQGCGTIMVRLESANELAHLTLADSGPGIPPALLTAIFDPFFTTKPVGQGTGLGLSISHELVARHGGTLSAENNVGGGAMFRLSLPLLQDTAASSSPATDRRLPTVLVVGPRSALTAPTVEALRLCGYRPLVAASPPPDSALRAILAPVATPMSVLADLRRAAPGARLIALGTPVSTAAADGAYWDAILPLPFGLDDLRRVVGDATLATLKGGTDASATAS